jgi:antitoxin component YwqK of YwqJK toxin-antitoxin module
MAAPRHRAKEHIHRHKDGSIWAKGEMTGDVMTGYWEWYRKDGIRMRSGYFKDGEQTGEWTTYDRNGKIHKVTTMKPKAVKAKTRPKRSLAKKRNAKA